MIRLAPKADKVNRNISTNTDGDHVALAGTATRVSLNLVELYF